MKKTISILMCILLFFCLFVPVRASEGGPAETSNYAEQNYDRWAYPVNSYLFENSDGGLTRVEYADGRIIVENYDAGFCWLSGSSLAMELPIWGGFFAGANYNYLVEGQNNEEEDDAREVIRIIQYDKDWKRIGSVGLLGANTIHPFDAGSLRFAEYADDLYIRTCHEMYTSSDGRNHQASVTIAVRQSELTVTDAWYKVMNNDYGYVSHSFNQFLLVDQDRNIVCVDHGDAVPRSAILMRYPTKAGNGVFTAGYSNPVKHVDVQPYAGYRGDNTTGATVGGLAETSQGYLVAHTYDGVGGGGTQLPYLAFVDKTGFEVTNRALPYEKAACPPMLVPTGTDGGYVLWNEKNDSVNTGWTYYYYDRDGNRIEYTPDPVHGDDTLYYVTYQADGSFGSLQTAADAPLSDCLPIVYRGNVVWYVTEKSAPTFYVLSDTGVKSYAASTEARAPEDVPPAPQEAPPAEDVPPPGDVPPSEDVPPAPDAPSVPDVPPAPDAPPAQDIPPASGGLPFEDVAKADACYEAVKWAYFHRPQITKGQDASHFAPDAAVKRGEAITFLWRAMGEPAPKETASVFEDLTADWYQAPVAWAVETGITNGTGDTTFSPQDTLTTAHIVTFLYRAMNPGKDGWYHEASTWAAANGYLRGLGLSINNETPCPRGAVVMILYNVLG